MENKKGFRNKCLTISFFVGFVIGVLSILLPLTKKETFELNVHSLGLMLDNGIVMGINLAIHLGLTVYYKKAEELPFFSIRARMFWWTIGSLIFTVMAMLLGFFHFIIE